MTNDAPLHIRIGHSPDPDDAFMFWALAKDRIPAEGLTFEHVLRDIETLNRWAVDGKLEITAISLHAYPDDRAPRRRGR
jgi:1,4-dihydroxy-6-naphthoate synthase